ncbi:MAG: 30S ribosomal protein S17 [Nitrososphaerales archaeon]
MARNIGIAVTPPKKDCTDVLCPFHGTLGVRGRLFSGRVVSAKGRKMVVVEHEYTHLIQKYKRYERSKSRMHAYMPPCIDAREGDAVTIAECRPVSKTVSFVVIEVSGGSKDGSRKE